MHARSTAITILLCCTSHAATTVAYWNFNNLAITSASTPGNNGAPTMIHANHGSGLLDLSTWHGNIDDFAGSTINASNSDAAGTSLSLIAGSGSPYPGNGGSIRIHVSLTGLRDPLLSFATQGTATGFNTNRLAWSVDGSNFSTFASPYTPAGTYAVQTFDLSSIDTLDGASEAWLQLSFDGASGASGNNRIDNLTITAIPEPSSLWLIGGACLITLRRRRRKTARVMDRRHIQP